MSRRSLREKLLHVLVSYVFKKREILRQAQGRLWDNRQ